MNYSTELFVMNELILFHESNLVKEEQDDDDDLKVKEVNEMNLLNDRKSEKNKKKLTLFRSKGSTEIKIVKNKIFFKNTSGEVNQKINSFIYFILFYFV